MEIPGETECALLVGGYRQNDYPSGDQDSFTGPESNPTPSCADPVDSYEVWRHTGDHIERLKSDMGSDDGAPSLIPIKDTKTGQHYYLHTGVQYGKCYGRQRLPFVFEWKKSSGVWEFLKSNAIDFEDALFEQCSAKNGLRCQGIAALTPGTELSKKIDGGTPLDSNETYTIAEDVPTFFKVYRVAQYRQYLDAVQVLDKGKLKALQAEGIPADWIAEAIRQIGKSDLSLAEKRKRTAWIFFDHSQLARALDSDVSESLESLVDWLPREDWAPVFHVIMQHPTNYYGLEYLREHAQEKGRGRLACDIDHVRGLICGEKWRVDQ